MVRIEVQIVRKTIHWRRSFQSQFLVSLWNWHLRICTTASWTAFTLAGVLADMGLPECVLPGHLEFSFNTLPCSLNFFTQLKILLFGGKSFAWTFSWMYSIQNCKILIPNKDVHRNLYFPLNTILCLKQINAWHNPFKHTWLCSKMRQNKLINSGVITSFVGSFFLSPWKVKKNKVIGRTNYIYKLINA